VAVVAEAAVARVAGPDPDASLNPALLWQIVLTLELPGERGREAFEALSRTRADSPEALMAAARRLPSLSNLERKRLEYCDIGPVEASVAGGAYVVSSERYTATMLESGRIPAALFAKGDWSLAERPTVGIVGTRGATAYGRATAMKFAEALALAGVTVVSGGAMGIDSSAHEGALGAGGGTISVLTAGVDRPMPAANRALFDRIAAKGCLVSQFPLGSGTNDYRPLLRNQVIAAMSLGLLAIEVPEQSGALSTVHAANELGRQVFVTPGNLTNPTFKGSHALIRDGATLVDHPDQVLEALGLTGLGLARAEAGGHGPVFEALGSEPMSVEGLVRVTGLDAAEVSLQLTTLELDGLIAREGGLCARKS